MNTLFLSDIHLSSEDTITADIFLNFLQNEAFKANAIYILGDLFEVWIGDDDTNEFNLKITQALRDVTARGIAIYIMHGNRDFLIGKKFAQATGCQLINDPTVINLYNYPTLLTHGDMLCTDDIDHLRFRHIINKTWVQKILLALPLSLRKKIARAARNKSKNSMRLKELSIMDANMTAVKKMMHKYQVSLLIHGHTHKPAIHYFELDRQLVCRIVLSDWHHQGSILNCTPHGERYLSILK